MNEDPQDLFQGELSARVERVLSAPLSTAVRVSGGYSAAARWRVRLRCGSSAFVKIGTTPYTSAALRLEEQVYRRLAAPFMPRLLGWEDDPTHPILLLEDLEGAAWPPPWTSRAVHDVLTTLDTMHSMVADLPTFSDAHGIGNGWLVVEENPEPFLRLQLTSSAWLERSLPAMVQAASQVHTAGNQVIHFDVRSGNLCVHATRGVMLVDWNWCCLGNGDLDTGFWLPSLESEGGPAAEQIMPGRSDIAAWVSGFFAARAGLPMIQDAPGVRGLQLGQLVPALRWTEHALGLPAR